MSTQIETHPSVGFGKAEGGQWRSLWNDAMRWFNVALCMVAAPFALAGRLRRKGSTGRDLERLGRFVLADIGLVKGDVVAAVNGQSSPQAMPANNNELCPLRGGVA